MEPQTIPGLSKAQAAKVLNVTPGRVDQLLREGRLTYWTTALGRLIDEASVQALKREREAIQERNSDISASE